MDPTELPLRGLHLPDPVGWWPLAPGWWALLALLVAVLVWMSYRAILRWRHNAARRHALRQFASIESDYRNGEHPVVLGNGLSMLLRRAMLAYAPRAEVAGLAGEEWLVWLDRDLPVPYFSTEGGKSLLQLPYRNPNDNFDDIDLGALFAAVKMRLETPLGVAS